MSKKQKALQTVEEARLADIVGSDSQGGFAGDLCGSNGDRGGRGRGGRGRGDSCGLLVTSLFLLN